MEKEFDIAATILAIKSHTKAIRKKRYRRSNLDRYQGEIFLMHQNGISCAAIQRWLKQEKNIICVPSTVLRYIKKNG